MSEEVKKKFSEMEILTGDAGEVYVPVVSGGVNKRTLGKNFGSNVMITVADLRLVTNPSARIYFVIDESKAGPFLYDAEDIDTEDNGGTVIVNEDGNRFKRVTDGIANVGWFATGDGSTDDTAALQAAFDAGYKTIITPPGKTFKITNTVTVPPLVNFIMDDSSLISYAGTQDKTALKIGNAATISASCKCRIRITSSSVSDWTNTSYIGVEIYNYQESDIAIVEASGFYIGARCIGDTKGFVYNETTLGILNNNCIGLQLANRSSGWCNENNWYGGRWAVGSTRNLAKDRFGIEIISLDASYVSNNKNLFHKPSFEINGALTNSGHDGTPIRIIHGLWNKFDACRNEGSSKSGLLMICDNSSNMNEAIFDSDDSTHTALKVTQTSYQAYGNTLTTNRYGKKTVANAPVQFGEYNIVQKSCPYNGTDLYVMGHWLALANGGTKVKNIAGITRNTDSLQMTTTVGVGVTFEFSNADTIIVKRFVDESFVGRVAFKFYDAAGLLITTNTELANVGHFLFMHWSTSSASFGGSHRDGTDQAKHHVIDVPAFAQKVDIIFTGGTAEIKLKGYEITFDAVRSASSPVRARKVPAFGFKEETDMIATQAPASGTWAVGDKIYNAAPAAAGTMGWVCTTAGTPGTWKTFGTISA